MKKYSIALKILNICLVMVAGIWLGIQIQQNETEKQVAYSDSLSTAVAVVNQDLGVTVRGQTVNYTNAVIETLGSDYTVVSASVAQNGLEKGTYGAIVTFPTDFSESIVSINKTKPNQAMLSLAINPNLPEKRYVSLYTQLVSMQQQVNNNIAYAYVETVYEQLHSAQDEIDKLLINDETDMEAVSQITLTNYTEMLNLGDMPTVEFEPISPDFTEFLAKAQTIADDMNQVYVESYANAQADFSVIKNQISGYEIEIANESTKWITDINTWSNNVSSYAQNVLGYKQTLDDWRNNAVTYRTDEVKYADAVNVFAANANAYLTTEFNNLQLSRTDLQIWRDDVNSILSGMVADTDAVLLDAQEITNKSKELDTLVATYNTEISNLSVWLTYLENYQKYIDNPLLNSNPNWPTENLPKNILLSTISGDLSRPVTDMNTRLAKLKSEVSTERSKAPDIYTLSVALPIFSEIAPKVPNDVPVTLNTSPSTTAPVQPQKMTAALTGIVTTSAMYNPNAYFDDQTKSKAQQSITQYSGYLSGVENNLKSNDANNLLLLNSAYRNYNEYVGELRTNIYDVHNREQGILSANITELSDTLKNTSFLNHKLMDSFATRMPNSRINSTVNQQVVKETVSPITYSYNYIRNKSKDKSTNISSYFLLVLTILAVAIVFDSLILWKKLRQKTEK